MLINDSEYLDLVGEVKSQIASARRRALGAVNSELVRLNWSVGRLIDQHSQWGNQFLENLSRDIRQAYPGIKGFAVRNLKYMLAFARAYPAHSHAYSIVQSLTAQLTWTHHILLLDKVKDPIARQWYAQQAAADGLSVRALRDRIERQAYERQALPGKVTNFEERLSEPQAALALDVIKDPYVFDFIAAREGMVEKEIQDALVRNVSKLLLELGVGFAFVGEHYPLEVDGEEFRPDLLFYHLRLRCFVVVELKEGKFRPEHAGKLNFYVSVVDDQLRHDTDQPTIGLLLCRDKRSVVAEYAFRDISRPIGVSEYTLFDSLPAEYGSLLPSAQDIQTRLGLMMPDDDVRDELEGES